MEDKLERGAKRAPEAVEFAVYDRTDSALVSIAGLFDIVHAHGRAEFAIALGGRRGAVISRGRPTNFVIMDAIPEDFGASVQR